MRKASNISPSTSEGVRRILVTGGAGFIGHHLVQSVIESADEVIIIDNLSTGDESNIRKCIRNANVRFLKQDVTEV